MRFLLIKAVADGHPYSRFALSLQRALSELGHEARVSDQSIHVVNGVAPANHLASELQAARYDAVLSFSSFFGGVTLSSGMSLFDALGVKFVGWQLDHPIYAPHSLASVLQGRYAIYSNPNHLRYAQAVKLPGRGMTMLPGGEPPRAPTKDYRSREWPVFVAASWNGVPQRLWEQLEDSPGKRLMQGVVDRLLADRDASLLDALNDTCATLGLGGRLGDDAGFDAQMCSFLREPLTYVRHVDRINVIRSLVDAGLPVTICGVGWRGFLGERRHLTYLDEVKFEDVPALYGNSRVVLNLNAANGACERAIYAALAGAAVASDFSQPLDELFGGDEGIGFFNRAEPRAAADAVGRLLDLDTGESVALSGQEEVMRSGLWRRRAQQLVEFLGAT
ncbi:glycosyltransferase family protein [Phenylobacterium sp.]|jgi:hypothetical protein|uniref:glycosyltransferase family protein n=1 Tax=Phenylobacterium sp. TaxID=1871053 RepID=UPI002E33EBDA|nr:hypothetical protein [Phenylobacterium sp.]HEX4709508.1 hypothetical protein [Phenylobacterium sp.]